MYDVGRAAKRPFTDIKSLIIGIVLMIIPIVNFAVVGYMLKCAKTAAQGDYTLPEWTDWGGLIISGIIAAVIMFVYMIPGWICIFLGGAGAVFLGDLGFIAVLLLPLGGLLMLIGGLFGSVGLIKYSIEGNIGSGFAFGEIIHKAINMEYIISYVVAAIVGGILCIVFYVPGGIHMFTALGETYSKI